MRSTKILVTAALALLGATGAGLAQARDDVQWSVTIGSDMPVYSQPVYSQPMPVYRRAPVVVAPAPVIAYRGYERGYGWGDRDHDGIPNRYDRVDNRRWDRDHDGIPNRYDRYDNRGWDRDHDGIPNWRDHHDGRR